MGEPRTEGPTRGWARWLPPRPLPARDVRFVAGQVIASSMPSGGKSVCYVELVEGDRYTLRLLAADSRGTPMDGRVGDTFKSMHGFERTARAIIVRDVGQPDPTPPEALYGPSPSEGGPGEEWECRGVAMFGVTPAWKPCVDPKCLRERRRKGAQLQSPAPEPPREAVPSVGGSGGGGMAEDADGHPALCIVCGGDKGGYRYSCDPCRERTCGDVWWDLTVAWNRGDRAFPRHPSPASPVEPPPPKVEPRGVEPPPAVRLCMVSMCPSPVAHTDVTLCEQHIYTEMVLLDSQRRDQRLRAEGPPSAASFRQSHAKGAFGVWSLRDEGSGK